MLNKNPDKAKEYLQSSADKDNAQSMYLLGKILLDEGKTAEALRYLEASAERDWRCQTRLGLLYYYKLNNRARGLHHLKEAADGGFEPAVKAVEAIEQLNQLLQHVSNDQVSISPRKRFILRMVIEKNHIFGKVFDKINP